MSAKSMFSRIAIVTITALAPLAAAHAAQDCQGDAFYTIKQFTGDLNNDTSGYRCVSESQAATTQRGAEGPVKSAMTEQALAQGCSGDPFYTIKLFTGDLNNNTSGYRCATAVN